jgi:3-hydroxymyristoyl/3-hydroxydecanoyl-(acyl carrier protein) dehydratase
MGGHLRTFSLVDRITLLEPGKRAEGRFSVPAHVSRFSSCLAAEAAGQLAAWVAMAELDFELRPVAGVVADMHFGTAVQPGQTLDLAIEIDDCDKEAVTYSARASAEGMRVVELAPGVTADSITVAKALTSAYVPLAGVTVPQAMYEAMLDESRKIGTFGHGFTYSGHPVAAAVALKALEIYAREHIADQVVRKTPHFQARLGALRDHPLVGEARGLGLIGGLELVADKRTKRSFETSAAVAPQTVRFAQEEGLIVRFLAGDVVSICPPLIIAPAEIDELFDRLGRALDRTLEWARALQIV